MILLDLSGKLIIALTQSPHPFVELQDKFFYKLYHFEASIYLTKSYTNARSYLSQKMRESITYMCVF